jgi:hypothetical protein
VIGIQGVTTLGDITWKAIASTSDVDARDNIGDPLAPIFLLDGNKVATSEADLWDGVLDHPINITELGTPTDEWPVWTGTCIVGTGVPPIAIGEPYRVLGGLYSHPGRPDAADLSWIMCRILMTHEGPCNLSPLYALSAPLTIASETVVPLPGALALAVMGVLSTSMLRYRKRK